MKTLLREGRKETRGQDEVRTYKGREGEMPTRWPPSHIRKVNTINIPYGKF